MINYEYPPIGGGGGVLCRDLAEGLVEKGHEVVVITSRYQKTSTSETVNGVTLHRTPVFMRTRQNVASMLSMLSYVPLAIQQGKRLARQERFDLINTYFAIPSGPAGHYLSRHFGIPNILHILGGDIYDPSKMLSPHRMPFLKQTVRKMLHSADRVIAESSDIEEKAHRYYGTKRQIDIVPLAVNPVEADGVNRVALGLDQERFVLVTVGRLIARKNLSELLNVFARMQSQIPSDLLILGDGPQRPALERRVHALGLTDRVRFLGRVGDKEKFQYLRASDLYISTALHEGFGIVFLEAMECGLPVICYDRGGQTDFLSDSRTGYVVSFGDTDTMVERCLLLCQDNERWKAVSDHNAAYVKNFYADKFVERHLDIFREVLDGDRTSALQRG